MLYLSRVSLTAHLEHGQDQWQQYRIEVFCCLDGSASSQHVYHKPYQPYTSPSITSCPSTCQHNKSKWVKSYSNPVLKIPVFLPFSDTIPAFQYTSVPTQSTLFMSWLIPALYNPYPHQVQFPFQSWFSLPILTWSLTVHAWVLLNPKFPLHHSLTPSPP